MNELQQLNRKQMFVYVVTMLFAGMTLALGIITAITLRQPL